MKLYIDRFVFVNILRPAGLIFLVALAALTLEQSVRLTNVLVEEGGPPGPVARMLVAILPEYCAQALQLSFFFGALIGFRAMARDNSLVAFHAAGQPLRRIVRPVMIAALFAGAAYIAIAGILQPRGEYTFARTGHMLSQGAFGPPLCNGSWLNIGSQTSIYVGRIDRQNRQLRSIFIEQRRPDGAIIVTSAMRGRLYGPQIGGDYFFALRNGRQILTSGQGENIGALEFVTLDLPLEGPAIKAFRARGFRATETDIRKLARQSFVKSLPNSAEPQSKFRMRLAAILANGFIFFPLGVIAAALAARASSRRREFSLLTGAAIYLPFVQVVGGAEKSDASPLLIVAPALAISILAAFLLAHSSANALQNSLRMKIPTVRGRRGVSWIWYGALNGFPKENVLPRSFVTFSASMPNFSRPRAT